MLALHVGVITCSRVFRRCASRRRTILSLVTSDSEQIADSHLTQIDNEQKGLQFESVTPGQKAGRLETNDFLCSEVFWNMIVTTDLKLIYSVSLRKEKVIAFVRL